MPERTRELVLVMWKMMMEDELLYEVDEQDKVIGPRSRGELHRLRIRHRAVHILVFNQRNQLFLQQRSLLKDVSPGLWDTSAAGHVDYGEHYADSAVRELREELGIEVPIMNLENLFRLEASEETGWEFIQVYRLWHEGPFTLEPREISDGAWIHCDQVDDWVRCEDKRLTRSFRYLWKHYQGLQTR